MENQEAAEGDDRSTGQPADNVESDRSGTESDEGKSHSDSAADIFQSMASIYQDALSDTDEFDSSIFDEFDSSIFSTSYIPLQPVLPLPPTNPAPQRPTTLAIQPVQHQQSGTNSRKKTILAVLCLIVSALVISGIIIAIILSLEREKCADKDLKAYPAHIFSKPSKGFVICDSCQVVNISYSKIGRKLRIVYHYGWVISECRNSTEDPFPEGVFRYREITRIRNHTEFYVYNNAVTRRGKIWWFAIVWLCLLIRLYF
jgi:hypothetical protein